MSVPQNLQVLFLLFVVSLGTHAQAGMELGNAGVAGPLPVQTWVS